MRTGFKIALVLFASAGLVVGLVYVGILSPIGLQVVHDGPVIFYAEGLAADDTTNYDGAGTLELRDPGSLILMEAALTLGTDTETGEEYASGMGVYFVWKSTTANAWDHFSILVEFPYGDSLATPLYELKWSESAEKWIITCFLAKEDTPTLIGRTAANVVWSATGTKTYDLSDNDYDISGKLTIAIAANYGGIGQFFDPEEDANGQWDYIIVSCDSNITAANVGFSMDYEGWVTCNDGEGWYYKVDLGPDNVLFRWDQEQQSGVIEIPFRLTGSVLDTATPTNYAELTFTLRECQDLEDAQEETWDSDTLTNFSGSPTAEVVDIGV